MIRKENKEKYFCFKVLSTEMHLNNFAARGHSCLLLINWSFVQEEKHTTAGYLKKSLKKWKILNEINENKNKKK